MFLNDWLGVHKIFDVRRAPKKQLKDRETGEPLFDRETGAPIMAEFEGHWMLLSAEFGAKYPNFSPLGWSLTGFILAMMLLFSCAYWAHQEDLKGCVSLSVRVAPFLCLHILSQ